MRHSSNSERDAAYVPWTFLYFVAGLVFGLIGGGVALAAVPIDPDFVATGVLVAMFAAMVAINGWWHDQ